MFEQNWFHDWFHDAFHDQLNLAKKMIRDVDYQS